MKLKQIFKSKSGMALENALLFMLIIFSLCALLTNLTLLGHYQVKIDKSTLLREVEIEQVGEDFIASLKTGEQMPTYENYDYAAQGNALSVWHKNDESQRVVLYVEAELTQENTVNVTAWRYTSLPTQAE